ncbi:MAG: hypothetical protein CMH31_05905 [Micavibrio sp.]|nr:hypothetical protein [Micavibrio sp.]|tara:strand:+ start:1494 stop:2885 length:1392 start_codon:yes stop_codon:yes gene_type:complete
MKNIIQQKKIFWSCFIAITVIFGGITTVPKTVQATHCCPTCPCTSCCSFVGQTSSACTCTSSNQTGTVGDPATTLGHITQQFVEHKEWFIDDFLKGATPGAPMGVFKALQLMTTEISAIAMQNVHIIGQYFDAKHQLETQRLFQTLTAKAHKDYHPSEGLCEFGSTIRSLAPSNRISKITSNALARHSLDRQSLANNSLSIEGIESDKPSRLAAFIKDFCDQNDNGENLGLLCTYSNNNKLLFNRDIDFTKTIAYPLTLDIDRSGSTSTAPTDDEKSLFAFMNNVFSHEAFPKVTQNKLLNRDNTELSVQGYEAILDQRALMAKRSVAVNSIASIAALKSKGNDESQPFIYAVLREMGGSSMSVDEIQQLLGDKPSYYAQMEVLTKIAYQNPNFYTELLDKPANIVRKEVALQAADLMQKRDIYRSLLRTEAVIATMLETALLEEQEFVKNKVNRVTEERISR